jgi:ubiquinone biosynthesis protein UbiJ
VSPFFSVLTQWVEALANGAADLDPLTRSRLDKMKGHSVAIEMKSLGEAATLFFDNRAIRFEPGIAAAPSVIVRGTPAALAAAFFSPAAPGGGMTIEGDELILTELRSIVRNFHPESLPPLDELVGPQAAQTITSLLELGLAAASALVRNVGEEGGRLVRAGARQRYLGAADFETMLTSMQALRLRVDRLNARTEIVERSARGRE